MKNKKLINEDMLKVLQGCRTLFDLRKLKNNNPPISIKKINKYLKENNPEFRTIGIEKIKNLIKFSKDDIDIVDIPNNIDRLLADCSDAIDEHRRKMEEEEERRYNERRNSREYAEEKNRMLVMDYEEIKVEMCHGVGQRRIKLMLNKLIKNGDLVADLYRTALEVENCNINAKKYRNTMSVSYKDDFYKEKERLLKELINKCFRYNNNNSDNPIVFGYQRTDNYSAKLILFFELPNMEQISFHCNLGGRDLEFVERYNKEWDGKVNSTIFKIEAAIDKTYKDEIDKLIENGK